MSLTISQVATLEQAMRAAGIDPDTADGRYILTAMTGRTIRNTHDVPATDWYGALRAFESVAAQRLRETP